MILGHLFFAAPNSKEKCISRDEAEVWMKPSSTMK